MANVKKYIKYKNLQEKIQEKSNIEDILIYEESKNSNENAKIIKALETYEKSEYLRQPENIELTKMNINDYKIDPVQNNNESVFMHKKGRRNAINLTHYQYIADLKIFINQNEKINNIDYKSSLNSEKN
jgi:hypothetical protein